MKIIPTALPEVLIVEPKVFGDERGYFLETWQKERYINAGLPGDWVQDNLSWSVKGILRGLHVQNPFPQGKLVSVLRGEVFDVAVDIRLDSPNFGQWVGVVLNQENKRQLYVPPGFAHGFLVLSEAAMFSYKCTAYYHPENEISIRWDDPDLAITWPEKQPNLSQKDRQGISLKDVPKERLLPFRSR